MKEFKDVAEVGYNPDTGEIEILYFNGRAEYIKLSEQKTVDANERELGTETEYLLEPNLHVVFYPEGRLLDWWYGQN